MRYHTFPFFQQYDEMDCGPTCLKMITAYYGKNFSLPTLRQICSFGRSGVSMLGISQAAEKLGFRSLGVVVPYEAELPDQASIMDIAYPCIAFWKKNHFVILLKANHKYAWIADPAAGKLKLPRKVFEKNWSTYPGGGALLLLEPTPDFYSQDDPTADTKQFIHVLKYLIPYRALLIQVGIGMLVGLVFQLITPFLTQNIIDVGIENRDFGFITLMVLGQFIIFVSQALMSFIQTRIFLQIGSRLNLAIVTDFLIKLMKLPLGFFDSKTTGDILQRVRDQERIESFLSGSTISIILSVVNFIVFSFILISYQWSIFLVFLISGTLYFAWVLSFLKIRKRLDYISFQNHSETQNILIELVQGMQEIKLQGSERKRRWNWVHQQSALFRINLRNLGVDQLQSAGAMFINQGKDILITFISAKAVIDGDMSLGMMSATVYIVGQLNGPLQQFIGFITAAQSAKISFERLREIQDQPTEEEVLTGAQPEKTGTQNLLPFEMFTEIPLKDIVIQNLFFKYDNLSKHVLKNINMVIPQGKITAIVGESGSGKTTLVKMLLGFYFPTQGTISIGNTPLTQYNPASWRKKCGVVLQDGFIFSDTIANNIAESSDAVNLPLLSHAMQVANIQEFVESIPQGYHTKIGTQGVGLSQGQRQRILIARAVYKDPDYIFLDEATNALDANNEQIIINSLQRFYENKTVLVIAHRLSTVKNADQIIVLDRGEIVESGNHAQLIRNQSKYYELVKNQLELGS